MGLKSVQEGPSWGQDGAKFGQVGAKFGQVGFWTNLGANLEPTWGQVGAKLGPKIEQNRSQERSKMRSFIKNATKIHPNRSQGLLGEVWRPSSGSWIDFGPILIGFWSQVGAKLPLKSVQEGPSWGQDGAKFGQVVAKFGQVGFWAKLGANWEPTWSQVGTKNHAKSVPRAIQNAIIF